MAARGRKKALATLRTILRHTGPPPQGAVAAAGADAEVEDALLRTVGGNETRRWIRGGSAWRSFVLDQYRANMGENDRSRVRVLRVHMRSCTPSANERAVRIHAELHALRE